ncbi:MAG: RHS repeat-associated core domain-containing protein [Bacteroidales bacterium]|nr:RHS repeat-associated core domain-containing protein [Bacteroidales bacterium]
MEYEYDSYNRITMNPHPPYPSSPSPARSLPSCAKHTTPPPSPLTANSKLLTPNWFYTFSAKEKDVETGLSYFGSRYYSSDLSIWLSVDPMSDKYASLSPYNYCANNPVKLVDPNGEEWETPEDANYAQHPFP